MRVDLDLLCISVYYTAEDLLPQRPGNGRRRLSDAEILTLCVAQVLMGSRAIAASCVRHAASSARRSSVTRAVPPRVRGGGRPARRDFPAAPAQRRAPARTTPRPNPTTDRISLLHMQRRAHTRTPRSPLTPQPLRTNRDPTTRTRSMHHPHSQSRRTQPRPRRLHRSPPARRRSHRRGSRTQPDLLWLPGASPQRAWAQRTASVYRTSQPPRWRR
jgi:hypothetical protein